MMSLNPNDEDLYTWAVDQVQRYAEMLDGIPSGYPRRSEFELRLIHHRRTLEIHKPRTDGHGVLVCDACVIVDPPVPGLPRIIIDCYAPCEHVALIAYMYSRCTGFKPEWISGYEWDPAS